MSQLSDFIDRAKLEALAEERYPMRLPYNRKFEKDAQDRVTFMAGVDAALALLGAETTEEWGAITVGPPPVGVVSGPLAGGKLAAEKMSASGYFAPISRRVVRTPWLPSEGGEKRG